MRCSRHDDAWVRKARAFARRWQNSDREQRERLYRDSPALYYAFDLHQSASAARTMTLP